MENRQTELEIKLSYLEDQLEELNRTVFRQQRQIDELQREQRSLRQQLQNVQFDEAASLKEQIPPHY